MSLTPNHWLSRRGVCAASSLVALAFVALLGFAARSDAAETVLWNNYEATPGGSVSFANTDGTGGGTLNLGGVAIDEAEGMAYDSATNRLFLASPETGVNGEIVFVNLDGSGAGVFTAPGAPAEHPEGITLDPATRKVYWINNDEPASIAWAKLDGSGGGLLNTDGAATIESAVRLALDPVAGRVYWGNNDLTSATISYANVNNSGGGNLLDLAGASAPERISGLSVDPAAGRIYWLDSNGTRVSFARLQGGGGADVNIAGAPFEGPYGLALDPSLGRLYWANYSVGEEIAGAIGFANLAGGVGGITPVTAPVDGPQDPLILKSPTPTAVPAVTRSPTSRSLLNCSQGGWGADFPGSFVYQAPRTFAYQWTLNGAATPGATAAALQVSGPGSYGCVVTATNQTGSASQASAPTVVRAADVKLTAKRKARVQPGGVAIFKVTAVNQGDLASNSTRVCAKTSKKAKRHLKAKPKCKPLGRVAAGGKATAKLRIKVGESASGTYKVTFQVKGAAGKAAKAKIAVAPARK